ncbi:nucleotidyltransferase family protein [Peribacillus sp. NPDC097675]|uniref:nucleotidyltransferase family protein n=1 Tax=Peribacillus sp. NPDC097675 TaxID=3390618 RepID=UPI003CFEB768
MEKYKTLFNEIMTNDPYIMSVLKVVEQVKMDDCWVCAGLIRNKVWDVIHNIKTPINDIDVIYFDPTDTSISMEKHFEKVLEGLMPQQPWSVKNQARMHEKNDALPYNSSYDAVAHFPESPTAIAVKLHNNKLEVMAPYGLTDLFEKIVRPTPLYTRNNKLYPVFSERMQEKKWNEIWRDLYIEM